MTPFFCKDPAAQAALFQKIHVQAAVHGEGKLYASPAHFLLSDTVIFQNVHFTGNKYYNQAQCLSLF